MGSKKVSVSKEQKELASAQAKATLEGIDFAKKQYADMYSLAQKAEARANDEFNWQRGLATEAQRRADEDRKFFYDTTGMQVKKFNADVDAYDQPGERDRIAARAVVDITDAMDQGKYALSREMGARGLNMGSPQMMAMLADQQLSGSLAKGAAATMAQEAARREGLQLRAQAAGLGSSFGGMAASGIGQASAMGMQSLGAGLTGMNAYGLAGNARNQSMGAAQGWGIGANSTFNSIAEQNMYNASQRLGPRDWMNAIGQGFKAAGTGGWMGGIGGFLGGMAGGGT